MAPNCHKFKEPRNPCSLIPNIVRNHGTGICCSASVWAVGPAKRCATACCQKKDNALWPSMMSPTTPPGCLYSLVRWVIEFLDCRCKSGLKIASFFKSKCIVWVLRRSLASLLQWIVQPGVLPRQDFDGVDLPSSSASMLETEEVKCEISKSCTPQQKVRMWAACARIHKWLILPRGNDVSVASECNRKQYKTSNEHFVDCKPREEMPEMPHVKWISNEGAGSCTRFDNDCKKEIEGLVRTNSKSPNDWEDSMNEPNGQSGMIDINKNVRVVRFIKLGQWV